MRLHLKNKITQFCQILIYTVSLKTVAHREVGLKSIAKCVANEKERIFPWKLDET